VPQRYRVAAPLIFDTRLFSFLARGDSGRNCVKCIGNCLDALAHSLDVLTAASIRIFINARWIAISSSAYSLFIFNYSPPVNGKSIFGVLAPVVDDLGDSAKNLKVADVRLAQRHKFARDM
jgi:hypothetical protein